MVREYKIYALLDPITGELRYIGQTIKKLNQRYNDHCNEKCNNKKQRWILSLKQKGAKPEMLLIETTDSKAHCDSLEVFWIAYFKMIGCRITNMTEGGFGGMAGLKQSQETIMKRVEKLRGQKRSPEVILKFKARAKETGRSPEFREKQRQTGKRIMACPERKKNFRKRMDIAIANLSEQRRREIGDIIRKSNKTRVLSEATKEKLRNRPQCKIRSEETKRKISATMRSRKWKYSKERIQKRLDTIKRKKECQSNLAPTK